MKKIALILSLILVVSLALAGCQSGTSGAGDPVSDRGNELDGDPSGYDPLPVGQKTDGEEISEQDPEALEWDKIPMVMVGGKLYYDTGTESTISGRCGVMDGEITSTVDGSETPTKDNQSNFGTGFEYQYGADNTIEIFMNEKWVVFEQREGTGN